MRVTELLLYGVAGWCSIGLVGVVISEMRGRRKEAIRNSLWIAAIVGTYFAVLLGCSAIQPQKVIAIGQDQCYATMCFTVTAVDEVPGLVAGDEGRVVRVAIRVANHGPSGDAETLLFPYLTDSKGRAWEPLPGLSGNRLNQRVASGGQLVSQPMFRVAINSTGLGLVLTHGNWQRRRLVIGDSDSLGHRRTVVDLGR